MEPAPKTTLEKWMREHGKDDATVAAAVEISRTQVNRLKRGESKPSYDSASALERLTGIPAGELFSQPQQAA